MFFNNMLSLNDAPNYATWFYLRWTQCGATQCGVLCGASYAKFLSSCNMRHYASTCKQFHSGTAASSLCWGLGGVGLDCVVGRAEGGALKDNVVQSLYGGSKYMQAADGHSPQQCMLALFKQHIELLCVACSGSCHGHSHYIPSCHPLLPHTALSMFLR